MCPLCYESSARFREEGKLPEATDRDAVLPVARMTRGLRIKRGLPVIGLILITAYATVLLYQAVAPRQWLQEEQQPGLLVGVTASDDPDIGDTAAATAPFATATVAPSGTDLSDVFISVKTTRHYHYSRLPAILNTWFQLAKNQTWFFTDKDDPVFQTKTNGHMINTKCSSSHNRKALCCKMSVEFDKFLESGKKWFCHFDDDNYVNVPRLVKLLEDYDPREDWYLGKPSIRAPLEILNREGPPPSKKSLKIRFWFATGGAGFCLSRALALKMMPVASGGKFISIGDKIRLPDDVTMGYIIEHLLKKPLTVVEQFHSHLEPMKFLHKETFHDQISFSFSKNSKEEWNIVKIDGFDLKYDPKRFKSIHCYLFPEFSYCPPR